MDEAILLWLDGIAARSEAFNAFITVISDNPLIKGVPILSAFEDVPDPRAENTRHDLGELLVIAFVSVLCGATSCAEMAAFGRAKESVFRGFLKLKHAVPSHDTFSAVFRMIDPK
ncbi:transposase family protein, partial [Rhizobium rhizogenes]